MGQRIAGRYRLREELGSGAHGRVHLAADLVAGGEVALKLSVGVSGGDALRREFDVLGRLRHPNLPRALDYGAVPAEDLTFLALEHVDGEPLDVLPPLAVGDLADLLAQACRGLDFLHRRGIVHGDVKPANLLVTQRPDGRRWLRIIDLGLSLTAGEGQRGVLRGTARFAAPSVLRGEPPDARSDLFSLGKCFAALFEAGPAGEGRRFEAVLRRLRAEDEDARYQSAERAVEDLLRSAAEVRDRDDGIFLVGAPLMGRAVELERLDRWLDELGPEHAAVPSLELRGGEGMGKSRLLDELAHRARGRGYLVCRAACPPGPPSPFEPLRPVLHHLATVAEELAPDTARTLRDLLRRLDGNADAGVAPAGDVAGAAHVHLALRRALEAAAGGGTLVILVDDDQWLDASTAEFLDFLRRTSRSGALAFAVAGRGAGVRPRGRVVRLRLRPLEDAAATELAATFLGLGEDALADARRLAASTEGHPGFVESAARAWAAARREGDDRELAEGLSAWVPASLRGLHERRWTALAADAKCLGEELSVLSRAAPARLVEALTTLPADEVPPLLDRLEAGGVLVCEGRGEAASHRFTSESLRRLVLDDLAPARRRALHLAAAEAWTSVLDEPQARSEILVEHFLAADHAAEAARHAVAAARRYVERHLHAEAIDLCERILAAPGGEAREADLRESLGDAYHGTGRFPRAREEYERAAALREAHPADADAAPPPGRLLRKRGAVEIALGRFPEARELLRAALAGGPDATTPEERACIHESLAHVEYRLGNVEGAREHLLDGLAALDVPERDPAAADLWNDLGIIEFQQGHHDKSVAHHQRALRIRDRTGDIDGQSRSLTNLANVALVTGDVLEASRNYEASLELKRRLGNVQSIAVTLHNLALLDHRLGRFGNAIAHFEETGRRQREISDASGRIRTLSSLARVWLDKGELDLAARLADAAVRIARRKGHRANILTAALVARGMVDVTLGAAPAARAHLEEGLELATSEGLRHYEGELRALLSEVLHLEGAPYETARAEIERAIAIAREIRDVHLLAQSLLGAGELALDRGEEQVAEEHAREALELVDRSPAPLLHARALLLRGRATRRRGPSDVTASFLHDGRREAEDLGVPELVWQSCAALARFHAERGRVPRAASWLERCATVLGEVVGRIRDPARQDDYLRSPRRARALDLLGEITSGTG